MRFLLRLQLISVARRLSILAKADFSASGRKGFITKLLISPLGRRGWQQTRPNALSSKQPTGQTIERAADPRRLQPALSPSLEHANGIAERSEIIAVTHEQRGAVVVVDFCGSRVQGYELFYCGDWDGGDLGFAEGFGGDEF
ncbi:MAG: hypothetical protein EOP06_15655, partial [Proteobacteria bacterium]